MGPYWGGNKQAACQKVQNRFTPPNPCIFLGRVPTKVVQMLVKVQILEPLQLLFSTFNVLKWCSMGNYKMCYVLKSAVKLWHQDEYCIYRPLYKCVGYSEVICCTLAFRQLGIWETLSRRGKWSEILTLGEY